VVQVKFDLNEEMKKPAAEAAVQRTVRFYQHALESTTCPDHGSKPSLLVKGSTMQRLAVSVETCCPALSNVVDARIRAVSRREEDL
jgi:hypothetical protein